MEALFPDLVQSRENIAGPAENVGASELLAIANEVLARTVPVESLQAKLIALISHRHSGADITKLRGIVEMVERLADNSASGEEDPITHRMLTRGETILLKLAKFLADENGFTDKFTEMVNYQEVMDRMANRTKRWVREHVARDHTITKEELAQLAKFLATEEAESIRELTKGWQDKKKFPDRPWVKVMDGHRAFNIPTIYILGWRDGDATPIHDHGPSDVGVDVFQGVIYEDLCALPSGDYDQTMRSGNEFLTHLDRRLLSQGEVIDIGDPYIHRMGCHDGGKEGIAITVHAYTDLREMELFYPVEDSEGVYLAPMPAWGYEDSQIAQVDTPKSELLDELVQAINVKFGIEILEEEARALGFVVNTRWQGAETGDFLATVFGINDSDSRVDASWKIYNVIHKKSLEEIDARLEQHSDPKEQSRLIAVKDLLEVQHASTLSSHESGREVYLGAVPYHFLPAWAKAYYIK